MDEKYRDEDPFKKYDNLFDEQDEKYYPTPKKKRKERDPMFYGFTRPKSSTEGNKKIPFWMIFIVLGIITNIVEYKFISRITFVGWIFIVLIIMGIVKAIRK